MFDLGKVLLDFEYDKAVKGFALHCELPPEEIHKAINQSPLLFRYETGLMTTGEFFDEVRRAARFCGELPQFEEIFGDIFSPIDRMIDLNRQLRARSVPTYIFSNTNEIAVKHIRARYPFFAEFTDYIFSYEHRSMKPDPRIYEVVEQKTGHRGAELLYIDDRLENVQHGAERGWRTIHHSDPEQTIRAVKFAGLIT